MPPRRGFLTRSVAVFENGVGDFTKDPRTWFYSFSGMSIFKGLFGGNFARGLKVFCDGTATDLDF